MSTYYYLGCEDCKQMCAASSLQRGHANPLVGDEYLRAFIVHHVGHKLRSFSEYNDECLDRFLDTEEMGKDHPDTKAMNELMENWEGEETMEAQCRKRLRSMMRLARIGKHALAVSEAAALARRAVKEFRVGHPAGCCLHIVVEDFNIEDTHLDWAEANIEPDHDECRAILRILRGLPLGGRLEAVTYG